MTQSRAAFLSHSQALLALGLPLIGSQLAQFGLHVSQTVMLGWYGAVPLAAGVLAVSTFFVIFILGSGFSKAVMPLVASAHARGDATEVRRVTRMGLWLSVAFGLMTYPVFWWAEPIFVALGQKPEVAGPAAAFMRVAGIGMIPALLIAVYRSYLSALGRTQVVLWVTLVALPINVAVNWALIFGNWGAPEMGVLGSAIATLSAQIMTLVLIAGYAGLSATSRPHRLFQRFWRLDRPGIRAVFRLGWPIGLTGLAESALFTASALMMGWIGPVALASHGIALEITALAFMVHVGLSNAVTVTTGRAFGEGDAVALRQSAFAGIVLSVVFALIVVVAFVVFREPGVALFISAEDPHRAEILALGGALMICAALFHLADAVQVMALGLLAGIQDTKVPMILASMSYWLIGIPSSYVLGFVLGFGGVGIWLGLVIGLIAAAGALMTRYWMRAPKP